MSSGVTRALAGIIGFFVALGIGLAVAGPLDLTPDENTGLVAAGNTIIVLFAAALLVGFVAYAATEYAQTRRFESISRQFDTRTIVFIPIAIAINIILGQTVGGRPQGADLPGFDRHDPGRRPGRAARRRSSPGPWRT